MYCDKKKSLITCSIRAVTEIYRKAMKAMLICFEDTKGKAYISLHKIHINLAICVSRIFISNYEGKHIIDKKKL